MLERDLVRIFVAALQRDFPTAVVQKNHGDQYQQHGRPDIEASIFGRHCVFELKAGTQPTGIQKTMISRYAKAGSVAGLVVYHANSDGIYYVNPSMCNEFTYRDVGKYVKIGSKNENHGKHDSYDSHEYHINTSFLWPWVSEAYMFYVSAVEMWNIYYNKEGV